MLATVSWAAVSSIISKVMINMATAVLLFIWSVPGYATMQINHHIQMHRTLSLALDEADDQGCRPLHRLEGEKSNLFSRLHVSSSSSQMQLLMQSILHIGIHRTISQGFGLQRDYYRNLSESNFHLP
jgi:hypothetical protein